MKIAVNRDYGMFKLTDAQSKILENHPIEGFVYEVDYRMEYRTDAILIAVLESTPCAEGVKVVEIPDNATDYIINDYDGIETVYYVVDGKIKRA